MRANTDCSSRSMAGSRRTTSACGSGPVQVVPRTVDRAASMLSLPHTPQADEPADMASWRWARSTSAVARIVTTLNSCSAVRSSSVQ